MSENLEARLAWMEKCIEAIGAKLELLQKQVDAQRLSRDQIQAIERHVKIGGRR